MRKVSPDTRARLDPRVNPARRGLREPRVRREIAAHKDLRDPLPLPNGGKAAGASTAPAASPWCPVFSLP